MKKGCDLKKGRILTGDRPTGRLHLGHYVGSLRNRARLQEEYETFVIIADVQALTTNFDRPERLAADVSEVALDNLAVGVSPEQATLFVQSLVPEIAELTVYFSMLASVNVLRHNPTIKTEAAEKGYKDLSYGFLGYPVSQAADIAFCRADLVPVGEDNVPHVELARKIVRRFNELYAPVLVVPRALVGEVPRLVGLDGNAKMSKSMGNAIYLADPPAEVRAKIGTAVTDPARIHAKDPGHPDICTIFQYHQAFNKAAVEEIETACRTGGIGCVACKRKLADRLDEMLEPIRERRCFYEARPELVREILIEGTRRARAEAAETMALVREAMKIDYFSFSKNPRSTSASN